MFKESAILVHTEPQRSASIDMFVKLTRLFKSKSRHHNPDTQSFNHFVQSDILKLYQWHIEQVSQTLNEQRRHDPILTRDVFKVPSPKGCVHCDNNNHNFHEESHDGSLAERTSFWNKRLQGDQIHQSRSIQPVSHDHILNDQPPTVHDVREDARQKQKIRIPYDTASPAPQRLAAKSRISTGPGPGPSEIRYQPPTIPLEASVVRDVAGQASCQDCLLVSVLRDVGLLALAGIDTEIENKWNTVRISHPRLAYYLMAVLV